MRWGKPTKNKKRRDPRHFLTEQMDTIVQAAIGTLYLPLLNRSVDPASRVIGLAEQLESAGVDVSVLVSKIETLAYKKWRNDIANAVQESMKKR